MSTLHTPAETRRPRHVKPDAVTTAPLVSLALWGTLVEHHPRFVPTRDRAWRDLFAPSVDLVDFGRALREQEGTADARMVADGQDRDRVWRLTATLRSLRAEVPPPGDPRWQLAWDAQADIALEHPPRPLHAELPELVHRLHEASPQGVAFTSNSGMLPGWLMRVLMVEAGFPAVSVASFSDEVAAPSAKPFPAIFHSSLEQLDAEPDDVIHIGDSFVADVCGAAQVGMPTVQVSPIPGRHPSTVYVLRALVSGRPEGLVEQRA